MAKPFKEEKTYRKWHIAAFYILMLGIALVAVSCMVGALFGADNVIATYLGYAAIACVLLFYAINLMKWRCPRCHKTLPMIGPVIECRYCKRPFMDKSGNQNW